MDQAIGRAFIFAKKILNNVAHHRAFIGRQPYLYSLKGEVIDVMKRGGCDKIIEEGNVLHSQVEAIKNLLRQLLYSLGIAHTIKYRLQVFPKVVDSDCNLDRVAVF